MGKRISLTGIKPTGTPHLGNYLGAIKPALDLSAIYDAKYFIADYHALNSVKDPERLRDLTYEVACTWLACGLDTDKVTFYRQSDVPEVLELSTMLMCFASKGRLNGAHAYKAIIADNKKNNRDPDHGVNIGLFTYPVLMAADILLFDAQVVPIGKDQIQHLEITSDLAEAVNANYKQELFIVPKALFSENTKIIPGLDGKKMSKSHQNTIPLFLSSKKLRKTVMKIVTNSQGIDEPKDPDQCNVFALYKLFATESEQTKLSNRYREAGMGWGEAKEELFMVMDRELSPFREKYDELITQKKEIDSILKQGAEKARSIATAKIKTLRQAMGFRT